MSVILLSDKVNAERTRGSFCDSMRQTTLLDPAARFLAGSGKRIRKSIVDVVFKMAGGVGAAPPCLGESIEWLHAGSLVIDDIQDDSHIRRERPSLHVEMGTPLALNAGNWMYFQALGRLFDDSLSRSVQQRLLQKMIAAGLKCHQGQALDLGARVDEIDPKNILPLVLEISRLKTGSLVAMAATFGAMAAGANRTLTTALSRFGKNVGIVLQMRNDLEELRSLVDNSSDELATRTDDLRNARVTWPWAWAKQVCTSEEFEQLVRQLRSASDRKAEMAVLASQLLKHTGSLGQKVIRERIESQLRLLGEHVLDTTSMQEMRTVLQLILKPNNSLMTEATNVERA